MATAPKVSVGLGTKIGYGVGGVLGVLGLVNAGLPVSPTVLFIIGAAKILLTTAGRMVQGGWNTAQSVETDAGTVVPGAPPGMTLTKPPTQP